MGGELVVSNRAGNDRVLSAGERIRGLATANPWCGSAAIDELSRARDRGAVGLYLHPTRQGFMPTDPIAEPLVGFADRVQWPVVFHTGTYINSDVLAVAEVARRFPQTAFICDNAGYTDMWFELPGLMAEHPNIVLGGALVWGRAIANTIATHGASRVLFGSCEPRDRIAAALRRLTQIELSETDRRAFLHDNAVRIFNLNANR
jgi:predicted TIM-barrel fold metal-dependent hydrolase